MNSYSKGLPFAEKPFREDANSYFLLAKALHDSSLLEEAIAKYSIAIALNPLYVKAYAYRGTALALLGRSVEAIKSFDAAISIDPSYVPAHVHRGNALRGARRFDEALESYNAAIRLMPDRGELYSSRGNALQNLGRLEEAIESYNRAIALKSSYAEAYNNRGVACKELGLCKEALADFDQALLLRPNYAEAQWNRGLVYLLLGNFEEGWRDYEARKAKRRPVGDRQFPVALWSGNENLNGKALLIHWEQGYGDVIQFSRYIKIACDAGIRVLFAPQEPLRALMRGLDERAIVCDLSDIERSFDYHCPIMSLPFILRKGSPFSVGKYLSATDEKISLWEQRLGTKTRPRVGIAWSGNVEPFDRSIPLNCFRALFDLGYEFVSLQKELRNEDIECLKSVDVRHFGDTLDDFSDTAALCELMDLVISIDTVVAHLAGALGKPTWVLLQRVPDWRWQLEREDTPWYPSMRLFRQAMRNDWFDVVERISAELTTQWK